MKGLCLLFYELGMYVGFLRGRALLIVLEPASSVIPTLARTTGPGGNCIIFPDKLKNNVGNTVHLQFLSSYESVQCIMNVLKLPLNDKSSKDHSCCNVIILGEPSSLCYEMYKILAELFTRNLYMNTHTYNKFI